MATSFFNSAFFGGEFFSEGGAVKTGTGGIDPSDARRRIFKPTGLGQKRKTLSLPKKSPTVAERIDDSRELQAEIAQKLATEFSADNAMRRDVVVPIAAMPLTHIEAEISALLRKKLQVEEDEAMLLLLIAAHV